VGDFYIKNADSYPGLIYYAHYESDHFVSLFSAEGFDIDKIISETYSRRSSTLKYSFDYTIRIGLYHITDTSLDPSLMCDRTLLALKSIKKEYKVTYAWYETSMRDSLIRDHSMVTEMKDALQKGQFHLFIQPQYNYSAGTLTGAEALVRWIHPKDGIIPPDVFIPLFENNGIIYELDKYVWEKACSMIAKWNRIDPNMPPISLSVNISRKDIFQPNIVDFLCSLPEKYDFEPARLHLEITESAYIHNPQQLICVLNALRDFGFLVEMDDFGSGYSSLNTLKNVPVDVLKLDMKFLSENAQTSKGGKILSSVIRIANDLSLPVIAEGVETKRQAEFLKSIGCHYMQGYYFSRPIPYHDFEKILLARGSSTFTSDGKAIGIDGAADFLSEDSQSTLLFNSFVGGAAIIEYDGKNVSALRINDKFYEAFSIESNDFKKLQLDFFSLFTPESRKAFTEALDISIATGEESKCELSVINKDKTDEPVWISAQFRCLTQKSKTYLMYMAAENITSRKLMEEELIIRELEYRTAAEQSNVYVCRYYLKDRVGVFDTEIPGTNELLPHISGLPEYAVSKGIIAVSSQDAWRTLFARIDSGEPQGKTDILMNTPEIGQRWCRICFTSIYDQSNKPHSAVISFRDVTNDIERLITIQRQADTDGLTELYNQAATKRIVTELLAGSDTKQSALLLIDIDDLKTINDTYGHPQGDFALQCFAKALKKHFRSTDIVGRIGGDEFAVMLLGMNDENTLVPSLRSLQRQIMLVGDNNGYPLHCSIGCTFCSPGDDYTTAYKRADTALYHVKKSSKNEYAFYRSEMETDGYVFTPHKGLNESCIKADLGVDAIVDAIGSCFPFVLTVNLTKDEYVITKSSKSLFSKFPVSGEYNGFLNSITDIFHADARAALIGELSCSALMQAYSEGRQHMHLNALKRASGTEEEKSIRINVMIYKKSDDNICAFIIANVQRTK
ncbi:MAG TPA: GGDEF domain-containing protein, partial [Bacillota bacterium]|nr:GGDEF domain-containing protein [Bacillota bacterium]